MKFYIKTFGCIQNQADSDQISQSLKRAGCKQTDKIEKTDLVIINSCVVRESAENRVYGLIENIKEINKKKKKKIDIVVTGCLAGWIRQNNIKKRDVMANYSWVKFKQIEEFDIWRDKISIINNKLIVPISFGCNNFCTYCVVPFSRGKEVSRKFEDIVQNCKKGVERGIKRVLLVGQNVNSYGADLIGEKQSIKIMGKNRILSLFPELLAKVASMDFEKVSFVSSNPWDFTDELIEVVASNKNIDRLIHLPVQAGDNLILKKMNRGYTTREYEKLVGKLRQKIKDVKISTDIIVGFPGETDEIFEKSFQFYKKIGFDIAYINKYSQRSGTVAAKLYKDDIPQRIKKERWVRLEKLINKN